MHTITAAAEILDTTPDVIATLAGDTDLWTGTHLTDQGMAILKDQLAEGGDDIAGAEILGEVRECGELVASAYGAYQDSLTERNKAIRAAVAYGHPKASVAAAAGISRETLYKILG